MMQIRVTHGLKLRRDEDQSSVELASRLSASTTDWRTRFDQENEGIHTKFSFDSICNDNWQIVEVWCNVFEYEKCLCWRMEWGRRKEQTIDGEPAHPLFLLEDFRLSDVLLNDWFNVQVAKSVACLRWARISGGEFISTWSIFRCRIPLDERSPLEFRSHLNEFGFLGGSEETSTWWVK